MTDTKTGGSAIVYAETRFGFRYGAAIIERAASHKGYVVVTIATTAGKEFVLTVSPSGRKVTLVEATAKKTR
jgi:hypothetical protein